MSTVAASRAQMLRHLTEAVEGGLPAPMSIDLTVYDDGDCRLELRMDDNRADEVDTWAAKFGTEAEAGTHLFTNTNGRDWRSYNARGNKVDWHGWRVDLWALVDEPTAGEAGAPC